MSITKNFLCLCISFSTQFLCAVTIMFDPAGDTKHPGKRIGNTYERTLSNKLVDDLKQQFASTDKTIRVLLSRLPGEQKDAIEKIRCVHQCMPDCFMHIALFESTHIKPEVFLYVNEEKKNVSHNALLPINQAHHPYTQRSIKFAERFYASLEKKIGGSCEIHPPIHIPSALLKGIPARSCIVEIGVKTGTDLYQYTAHLAESILEACKEGSA